MLFSELIREERKRQGLLARELSAKAGVNEGYISAVENGKKNPNIRNAVRLVKALKLDAGIFAKITDPAGEDHGSRTLEARRASARSRRGG